jgi:hypothetical protein
MQIGKLFYRKEPAPRRCTSVLLLDEEENRCGETNLFYTKKRPTLERTAPGSSAVKPKKTATFFRSRLQGYFCGTPGLS